MAAPSHHPVWSSRRQLMRRRCVRTSCRVARLLRTASSSIRPRFDRTLRPLSCRWSSARTRPAGRAELRSLQSSVTSRSIFQTCSLPRSRDTGATPGSGVTRFICDEPLLPEAERAAERHELANVIGGVIGNQEDRAQIRLVPPARRYLCGEIVHVARQGFQLVTRSCERRDALLPCLSTRRFRCGPVIVGPLHGVHILRIHAEVEDVVLRQPYVLELLPGGMVEPRRTRAALICRDAVDSFVESDVRLFPIEHADEVIANCVV